MQKKLHQAGTVNIVNLDEIMYIKYRTHEIRNYFCLMNSNLPSLLSLLSIVQLAVVCLVECLCGPVDDSWLSTVRGAEKSVRISGLAWIGLTTCVVHWQDRRQCVCDQQVDVSAVELMKRADAPKPQTLEIGRSTRLESQSSGLLPIILVLWGRRLGKVW